MCNNYPPHSLSLESGKQGQRSDSPSHRPSPPPAMATGEQPQKHLLTLIREFATERSHGERRVSDLKKRLLTIESDTAAAATALDSAKRSKESAEQQLKGFQVHLSMTDASILAQQARLSLLQDEVSKVGADLAAMKTAEGVQRDEFIGAMYEINREIRQFRDSTVPAFWKQYNLNLPSDNGKIICNKVINAQDDLKGLLDEITSINAQLDKVEEEYKKELHDHDEVCQALVSEESRVFFVEAVMEETKQLQELARQTSEMEKAYATLGEELQKSYTCPRCQFNNMGELETTEPDVNN